ncbi:GNAT family N-acetyltransferase [Bacillus sp. J33]|uniref:GNAT family N-acetyltransferase n=1 Tax=Bacillus sp. J33 TaxID=935836 RepID=UPI00047DDBCE|nr:GNAT family N-acetyltransferase [Bacillus sp. J33]
MKIRKLGKKEFSPKELLLLADPSIELIEEYLVRGETYICEEDGQIMAVCVLLSTRPCTCEIVNIAVADSCQGRGIGRKLIEHSIQMARLHGYRTIEIGTGNSSIGQLALYQKCGFRITGVDRDYFVRHYERDIFENGIQCKDMIRLSMDL